MRVLALETSTNIGSVALFDSDRGAVALRSSERQKSHSEFIHVAIQECLEELGLKLQDLDALAVGQGPGSFTGLRVAGNTAKALAWALDKPLVSVDSLSILAWGTPLEATSAPKLVCMLNAFRNMVYFSSFVMNDDSWDLVEGPQAFTPAEVEERITSECLVVGDGFEAYEQIWSPRLKTLLKIKADFKNFPQAEVLARWVANSQQVPPNSTWEAYSPLYIRSTDSLFKRQRP